MPTLKPVSGETEQQWLRVRQYAFYGDDPEDIQDDTFPYSLGTKRGLFDDEDLVSTINLFEFDVNVRNQTLTLGGASAVSTGPEYRNRGLARETLRQALQEWQEKGVPISGLWPASGTYPFYQSQGWGLATNGDRYRFDPTDISFPTADTGAIREITGADEALDSVHDSFRAQYDLVAERDNVWWEGLLEESYAYVLEGEGDVKGYVIYSIENSHDDSKILDITECYSFNEIRFPNTEVLCELLDFVTSAHQIQIDEIAVDLPTDVRLYDLVDDPQQVTQERISGPMIRLVSVEAAIESLLPEASDQTLSVDVTDSLAPWNDGQFVIDGATAEVRRVNGCSDCDISLMIDVLSQIVSGYLSPVTAAGLNRVETADQTALKSFERLFPSRPVHMTEFY